MSQTGSTDFLPSAMEEKLAQISRRQAVISALRAVAIGASVLLATMVLSMLIDWQLTLFSTGFRSALTATSLLLSVATVLIAGVPALLASLKRIQAAVNADEAIPQLEERWQTVVGAANSNHLASSTAKAMLQQVTSEAVAMGRIVQARRVAGSESLYSALKTLAGCAVVLMGFLAINWPQTSVLLRRFFAPTADISATSLTSLRGDITIARGEFVDLVTEMKGLRRNSAILTIARADTKPETVELAVDKKTADRFVHRMQADETFQYRVQAGDGQTAWHKVNVVDYPELAEVKFTVVAPAYLNRPNVEKSIIPGRLKVMQGSLLQLQIRPKAALQRLELTIAPDAVSDEQPPAPSQINTLAVGDDGWYRFSTQLTESLSMVTRLWNSHGLTNEVPNICRIQVLTDNAPVARVLTPTNEMSVATDDVVDIKFEAHDDHGITRAELVVYDESAAEEGKPAPVLKSLPIPLAEQQLAKHVVGMTQLDLKQLNLKPGTQISYAIRVTDNRMVADELETGKESQSDVAHRPNASRTPKAAGIASQSPDAAQARAEKDGDDPSRIDQPDEIRDEPEKPHTNPDDESTTDAATLPQSSSEENPRHNGAGETDNSTGSEKGRTSHDSRDREQSPLNTLGKDATENPSDGKKPSDTEAEDADTAKNADHDASRKPTEPGSSGEGQSAIGQKQKSSMSDDGPPRARMVAMAPQQSESGQNGETNRRVLRITERLSAVAAARETRKAETNNVRDRVVQIDGMLAEVETGLTRIVNREIADDDQSAEFKNLDTQLGAVEGRISTLRKETRDEQFAFVGLQLLDIGRSHVTPARENVFLAIREPVSASSGNSREALQRIVRARELLAALLKRYDRVTRDQQLAEALKDGVKIYEVYVEKMQQLMREVRQNQDPLERKMEVIEVDQAYLDRYAEVLTMRRDMLAEFGRILGDDPRLLARYLNLVRRRRSSLRDQLAELARSQKELFAEFSGWQAADAPQKDDLWNLAVELRMQTSTQLAKDAADLGERIEKQFPLVLEASHPTSARVIALGREIVATSRRSSLEARRQIRQPEAALDLRPGASQLTRLFVDLDAALEQLNFENSSAPEVTTYVTGRLLESRTIADQAALWRQTAEQVHEKRYHGFIEVDQHRIAVATELLRVELLGIETELSSQFQQLAEKPVPDSIVVQIGELQKRMEDITFEQTAAESALSGNRLSAAEKLLKRANENFAQAEELFDRMRRAIADALDEAAVRNPTIAELEDPKLDEFLTQLEREPSIDAQLGIPERPRNFRVIAESLIWQQEGAGALGSAEEEARARMKREQREQQKDEKDPVDPGKPEAEPEQTELTDEDRLKQEELGKARAELAKAIEAYKERAKAPSADAEELKKFEQAAREIQEKLDRMQQAMDPDKLWKPMKADLEKTLALLKEPTKDRPSAPEDAQRIEVLTSDLQRLLDQIRKEQSSDNRWKMVAEFERKKEVLKAVARGERIPDEQWNKLISKLEDGLWQVGGRSLPEEYRKAIEQYQEQIRKLTSSGRGDER